MSSEPVSADMGNILTTNGADTKRISVSDTDQVRVTSNTVTINPNTDLVYGNAEASFFGRPSSSQDVSTELEPEHDVLNSLVFNLNFVNDWSKFGFEYEKLWDTFYENYANSFLVAADRLSSVVTGYAVPSYYPDETGPHTGALIEDLHIYIYFDFIDGPGGILAEAGPIGSFEGGAFSPLSLREDSLPALGVMVFDIDDFDLMSKEGIFADVALHEMIHVLGFGTLWESFGLVEDGKYIGTNALAEYQLLSPGALYVPLEAGDLAGTSYGHWEESTFGSELMTGFFGPYDRTSPESGTQFKLPISRVSIGALEDLGYKVNYDAADSYTMLSTAMASGQTSATVDEVSSHPTDFYFA